MMRCGAILALLLGLGAVVQASEPPSAVAERKQIQHDRTAAETRYQQAEAECKTRFAVSGCIAEAQAQRRTAMTELRQRELALDEAKRRAEVEENAKRVQTKQTEAAARPVPVPQAASAPPSAAASAASAPARRQRKTQASKTADEATAAAARVAAQQRRASEAAAHRQDVEQRNAERAARGKKSTPLPVPSAASVAATASAPTR